ncbi:MAG: carboxypeptidase-like regulatory domain-containing protein, partial [Elusimicrobiota bacterium]
MTTTTAELEVALEAGQAVTGRLAPPYGVEEARSFTVALLDSSGRTIQSASVQTGSDGSAAEFTLRGIADGKYLLAIADAQLPIRYLAAPVALEVEGSDLALSDIQLYPAGGIRGSLRLKQVLVSGSSTSVEMTEITASNIDLLPEGLEIEAEADPWVEGGFAQAERASGRLSLDAYGRFAINGLMPGSYRVRVHQEGSDAMAEGSMNLAPLSVSGVKVAEGQAADVGVLDLSPGRSVSGMVTDPAGLGLANVEVSAEAAGGSHEARTLTDSEGRFTLAGLDPALRYYDLIAARREGEEESGAEHGGYGEAVLSGVDILNRYTGLVLSLERAEGALDCSITPLDGGSLVNPDPRHKERPGAKVYLQRIDRLPRKNHLGDVVVLTRGDGSFSVGSLVPGAYRLMALSLKYKPAGKTIQVKAGANKGCSLPLDSGAVLFGKIVKPGGGHPGKSEVTGISAVAGDGSDTLIGELESPGNSKVVSAYRISGFKAGTAYQLVLADSDGDLYAPPEASIVRLAAASEERLDILFKPVKPYAMGAAANVV